ncbi:MAG: hypothetical protein V1900_02980 [Candidatus Aenigmatarchaeota archaeon]
MQYPKGTNGKDNSTSDDFLRKLHELNKILNEGTPSTGDGNLPDGYRHASLNEQSVNPEEPKYIFLQEKKKKRPGKLAIAGAIAGVVLVVYSAAAIKGIGRDFAKIHEYEVEMGYSTGQAFEYRSDILSNSGIDRDGIVFQVIRDVYSPMTREYLSNAATSAATGNYFGALGNLLGAWMMEKSASGLIRSTSSDSSPSSGSQPSSTKPDYGSWVTPEQKIPEKTRGQKESERIRDEREKQMTKEREDIDNKIKGVLDDINNILGGGKKK